MLLLGAMAAVMIVGVVAYTRRRALDQRSS